MLFLYCCLSVDFYYLLAWVIPITPINTTLQEEGWLVRQRRARKALKKKTNDNWLVSLLVSELDGKLEQELLSWRAGLT